MLHVYKLYQNVKNNTLSLNTFNLPYKLLESINDSDNWEILLIKYENKIISAVFTCLYQNIYCPVFLGLDYNFQCQFSIYKKTLFFVLKRALERNVDKIYLGITANETKKAIGAFQHKQVAFLQVKDKYNQELIDSMAFEK